MNPRHPTRVLVYGSCVSRDTFEYLPKGQHTLIRYVARQSLISAYSPPLTRVPESAENLPSAFQRRMQRDDLLSSLPGLLQAVAPELDMVLWDLADERLGVYRLPGGEVVTRSLELISSGLEEEISAIGTYVEFGTDTHLGMWTAALDRFLASLSALSPEPELVLLALPWAEKTEEGHPTTPSFSVPAVRANGLFQRYYRAAQQRGVQVVRIGVEVTRSSTTHQWGEAPFHYSEPTYQAAVEAIMARPRDTDARTMLREHE